MLDPATSSLDIGWGHQQNDSMANNIDALASKNMVAIRSTPKYFREYVSQAKGAASAVTSGVDTSGLCHARRPFSKQACLSSCANFRARRYAF